MAAPTIDELTSGVHRLAGDMQKSREGAEGIVHGFTELLNKLIPVGVALKAFQLLTGGVFSHYGTALISLTKSTNEIYAQRRAVQETLRDLRAKFVAHEINLRQYRDMRLEHTASQHILRAQSRLARELEATGRSTLGIAAVLLGLAAKSLATAIQYNEALLEANASFGRRLGLMQSMARVQAATGTAQVTLVNGTRALVRYGLENKATFEANLKTVVMLHDAIGLSADESAHLAAVTENYARASFQDVADVVATIVNSTALAGAEVKNLGIELQRALGVVTPGQTNLPQVIQALSGYEAALKEVTGRVGSFQKLVTNLATPEGMLQAGMLGVTPDMIRTKEGIDQIMGRFDNLVQRVVGNSEGLNRVWRLDTVAKMMNLSREEVSEMVRALELKRGMDIKELTLQELYAQQVINLNQGVTRLITSLGSLLQQGLYPVVGVLSLVINWLASFIQMLAGWRYAGYVAMGAVTVAGIFLWNRLRAVRQAFLEVAWAVQLATSRLRAHAVAQMGGRIATGGGGFMGGIGSGIATLFTGTVIAYLAVIAAALGGLAAILYRIHYWNKLSAEETLRVNRVLSARSQSLEQRRREQMYLRMRYGDTEGATKSLGQWLQETQVQGGREGKTLEQIQEDVRAVAAQGMEDLTRAGYTSTIMDQRFARGDRSTIDEFNRNQTQVMGEAVKVLNKILDSAKQGVKQEKDNAVAAEDLEREKIEGWIMKSYRSAQP